MNLSMCKLCDFAKDCEDGSWADEERIVNCKRCTQLFLIDEKYIDEPPHLFNEKVVYLHGKVPKGCIRRHPAPNYFCIRCYQIRQVKEGEAFIRKKMRETSFSQEVRLPTEVETLKERQ